MDVIEILYNSYPPPLLLSTIVAVVDLTQTFITIIQIATGHLWSMQLRLGRSHS